MTVDGRVDMLRVRSYNGHRVLSLECEDGTTTILAKFGGPRTEELFWEWHESRMAGILEEVLEVWGEENLESWEKDQLRKIITGKGPAPTGE